MPIGVLTNSFAVLLGGFLGAAVGKKIPEGISEQLPAVFGLSAITIGITVIVRIEYLAPVVLALILGTIIGELLGLEQNLKKGLEKLIMRAGHTNPQTTEILTIVIVLFCFSGAGIFGALNEGFTGDGSILIAKSVMDFFTAIIFGATAGRFVGLVAVPQCLTGLILFSSAGFIVPLLSAAMLNDFKACGGIITLAAGLKVANIKSTRIINMLPALFLVMIFSYLWVKIFS